MLRGGNIHGASRFFLREDASAEANAERRKRLTVLRTEETETNKSIRSLFMMVEKGVTRPDDPFLKERLAALKLRLTSVRNDIVQLDRQTGAKSGRVTPEKITRFAEVRRAKLRDPEDWRAMFQKRAFRPFLDLPDRRKVGTYLPTYLIRATHRNVAAPTQN